MPLSDHVSLTISQDTVGVARAGFGTPLILSCNAAGPERVKTYTDILGVAEDHATDSPEYLAARAIFSQSPHPSRIKIGRAAGAPTLKYTITPVVQDLHTYTIHVKGEGITAESVSYTSDGTATAQEICDGLRTALDAVVGENYGLTGTTTVIVTGDAAGDWFSLEVDNIADLAIVCDHAEPATTIATDLTAISNEDDDWYCLITLYNSTAYVAAAAAAIEALKKIYLVDVNDSSACTVAEGSGTDVLDDIDEANYERTAGAYHPDPSEFFAAAWAGRCLSLDPGSLTFAYKTLAGVTAPTFTATHRSNLEARGASYYKSEAGVDFVWEGKRGDGDYIDVTRDLDWLDDEIRTSVFGALAGANKIPYTDAGVNVLVGRLKKALRKAQSRGVLTTDTDPVVTYPKVADVDSADKAARHYPDLKFSATLAGAIHRVTIIGVVSA